jgi:predicted Zn-dependent protease
MKTSALLSAFITLLLFSTCSKKDDDQFKDPCGGAAPGGLVNLVISTDDDIQMGRETENQILSDPGQYPILDSAQNKEAYAYLYKIRNNILSSGKVYYKDEFPWKMRIIKDDSTLNAFCTPGGFIFVYTGIIKYLDNETQLAGVLGHEIAHADRRHGANQMIKYYGVSVLLDILSGGDPNQLEQMAAQLLLLKYGRADETEADDYSVRYLYPSPYDPRGAKYFFEKISAAGGSGVPEFLSTHPDPGSRVSNIEAKWKCLGGRTDGGTFDSEYQAFKSLIP